MPGAKYKFVTPVSYDHEIHNADGKGKIGELRIKPSSILWKSKGQQKYRAVPLDDFIKWIEEIGKQAAQ